MSLNAKSVAILRELANTRDYVRVQELAEKYKITDRAVRYNLDKIERFLLKHGFTYFHRHHIKGIKIDLGGNVEEFIKEYIGQYTPYKYIFSRDERIIYMMSRLLQSSKPMNLQYFQSKLCVAKNTLLKDLQTVEEYLLNNELELIRKPRVGLFIKGSERSKRKLLKAVASKTITTKDIVNYLKNSSSLSKINNLQFETLFSDLDIDFIDKLIIKAEGELGREFDDESYGNLITHIAIMIKRIQLDKNIYLPEIQMEDIFSTNEYKIAKEMIRNIEERYKIAVPKEEIGYITLRFLGAKILKDTNKVNPEELNELYKVSRSMTEEIERIYQVDFGENKEKVIEGLILHLRPAIYRIKFNLTLINPMFDEIIKSYKNLFINTKKAVRYFQHYLDSEVNDHETSYIALHFGAALENAKEKERKISRIVLVCGTGIGTAKMLETQIKKHFNVEIVNTLSSRAVKELNKRDYDYIISTIDILEMDSKDYIKVNSILLKKDYEYLKNHLQERYIKENQIEKEMRKVTELIEVVKKYYNIEDIHQLQYEFMRILLSEYQEFPGGMIYMLKDLLRSEFIKINVECDGWEKAIKEGTDILLNHKAIEERYYEEIINNFRQIGPYMVVAPGIVLSHARPENGVLKLAMSLVTLKKPIKFGSETNDPVKLIITLAAPDSHSHLKALAQLMELLMNNEDLSKIINATNKEEILHVIKNYSI